MLPPAATWLLPTCRVAVPPRCVPADSDPEWATLRYPENLTVKNMLYFVAIPTLTYQVSSWARASLMQHHAL